MALTKKIDLSTEWTLIASAVETVTIKPLTTVHVRIHVGPSVPDDTEDALSLSLYGGVFRFDEPSNVYAKAAEVTDMEIGIGMSYEALRMPGAGV